MGLNWRPRLKREGPKLFLDLTVPYIYHILLYREVDRALWSPLAKPWLFILMFCHPISTAKSVSANLWMYFLLLCYSRRGRKHLYPYHGGNYLSNDPPTPKKCPNEKCIFLMIIISWKSQQIAPPPSPPWNFQFPSMVGTWIFSWVTHFTLHLEQKKKTCYLPRGLYKLHSAAHTMTNLLSRFSIREIGSSFLIIRNVFSRLMACSTKMRWFCTSAFVNCSCPRFPGQLCEPKDPLQ